MILRWTDDDDDRMQMEDFRSKQASIVRRVVEYSAKGSAAFAEAHEHATTPQDGFELRQFWAGTNSSDLVLRGTLKELEDGHGYCQLKPGPARLRG